MVITHIIERFHGHDPYYKRDSIVMTRFIKRDSMVITYIIIKIDSMVITHIIGEIP